MTKVRRRRQNLRKSNLLKQTQNTIKNKIKLPLQRTGDGKTEKVASITEEQATGLKSTFKIDEQLKLKLNQCHNIWINKKLTCKIPQILLN